MIAAPLVMRLYLNSSYDCADLTAQRDSAIAFARYCLPQIFFYGMFVLLGQVLNARGRFGPMMWAPIANNVIAILVLVLYLVWFGPLAPGDGHTAYTATQELVLGLGSTLGIAVQVLVLLPYLRAAGVRFRPRYDFRHSGLGHTLRLGRVDGAVRRGQPGRLHRRRPPRLRRHRPERLRRSRPGAARAAPATRCTPRPFLFVMVPHAIITVSLATAILPRLSAKAADGDLTGLAGTLAGTLRTALAIVIPFAFLLPLVAYDAAKVLFGYGATATTFDHYVTSMILFGPGVVFFTVHYLMLRGFYALELNRLVFFVQCAIAATNVVVALLLVSRATPAQTSPALVLAYLASYVLGATVSYLLLRARLGGLETAELVRFLVRLLIAALVSTARRLGAREGCCPGRGDDVSHVLAGVRLVLLSAIDVGIFVALARLLRLREVTTVLDTVIHRFAGARDS